MRVGRAKSMKVFVPILLLFKSKVHSFVRSSWSLSLSLRSLALSFGLTISHFYARALLPLAPSLPPPLSPSQAVSFYPSTDPSTHVSINSSSIYRYSCIKYPLAFHKHILHRLNLRPPNGNTIEKSGWKCAPLQTAPSTQQCNSSLLWCLHYFHQHDQHSSVKILSDITTQIRLGEVNKEFVQFHILMCAAHF